MTFQSATRSRSIPATAPVRTSSALIVGMALVLGAALTATVNVKPLLSQAAVSLVRVDVAVVAKGYRASRLIGSNVDNDKNERVGKLDDIIIGQEDRNLFAVVQVGGFLGIGSRLVVIPYQSLKIEQDGAKIILPGATKDELNKLQEFNYRS